MADPDVFNGAKCTWPTTSTILASGLLDANDGQSGADVDLSVTTSAYGTGREGIRKREMNVTVLGTCTASRGDAGIIKIVFGSTGGGPTWVIGTTTGKQAYISSKTVGGAKDGETTTQFTFRPRKSS